MQSRKVVPHAKAAKQFKFAGPHDPHDPVKHFRKLKSGPWFCPSRPSREAPTASFRLKVVDSRASREVVGLLVMMELKDGTVRFTNGCEE